MTDKLKIAGKHVDGMLTSHAQSQSVYEQLLHLLR